ncbi:MAG: N-acetylmuramoyl-L-alanine amidase [Raineya sp.]|jgi:hypothetical protein|nr:N-acetylmuramoyl-L-alanine amidase [Raineya sp.]
MKPIVFLENSKRRNILFNILKEFGFKAIEDFQRVMKIAVDGVFGLESWNALYRHILKVDNINGYFEGAYHKQVYEKKMIVWHHSAGNDNAKGMFVDWKTDKRFHVATCIGIQDDGTIVRGYSEEFWAVHVGAYDVRLPNYFQIETQSVGVEICNWGALVEKNGKFYNWVGNVEIPRSKVVELNYKGTKYFEAYTDEEVKSLKYWSLLVAMRFNIPLVYREKDMWEESANAKACMPGIYTHNSFISWKTDVSPQPKLIAMAKSLEEYEK